MRCTLVAALSVCVLCFCVRSVQAQACRNGCNTHPDVAGLNCVSGLANESGTLAFFSTSGIPACSAAGTYSIQHATRFDAVGTTEITHLCIATVSSSLSAVQIFSAAGSPSQPPAAAPLFQVFTPAINNAGNIVIVDVAPVNAPLQVNGSFWIVVTYNNVMPTTVTQGIAPRTGGKAMLRVGQNCTLCQQCGAPCAAALSTCQTWVDYDNLPIGQYVGNAPRIRPLRFDTPQIFCPSGMPDTYDQTCCDLVCQLDPSCCMNWDPTCFAIAGANCSTQCQGFPPTGTYNEIDACGVSTGSCLNPEVVPCGATIVGTTFNIGGNPDEDWYAIDFATSDAIGLDSINFVFHVTSSSPVDVDVLTVGDPSNCAATQTVWASEFIPSCGFGLFVQGQVTIPPQTTWSERLYIRVRNALGNDPCNLANNKNWYRIFTNTSNCIDIDNDSCATSFTLGCNSVPPHLQGTTIGAAPSNPPACGGATGQPGVWYSFTGNDQFLQLDTCGSDEDMNLAVFIGSCPGGCIASATSNQLGNCVDPDAASLEFLAFAGIQYNVYVSPRTTPGDFTLSTVCVVQTPPNDLCANAQPIPCSGVTFGTTTNATIDNAPICNGIPSAQEGVWYHFVGTGGTATADICDANTTTLHQISVYTGSCAALSCVNATFTDQLGTCAFGPSYAGLSFPTVLGQDYFIHVHANGVTGDFVLNVNCPPPGPPNDDCTNAMGITPGGWVWDNCGATTDGPPEPCGFTGINDSDVWYEFIMPCDGTWLIHVGPAPVDRLVGVYDMCPQAHGTLIACDVQPIGAPVNLSVPGVAGQSYWIRIGSSPGTCSNAPLVITESCSNPCPGDCVTSATFAPPPDGIVDGADLALLLGAWGPCPAGGCCSDTVTSATFAPPPDGVVDGADLAMLLGNWGPCP
jgi:hypothetical protein